MYHAEHKMYHRALVTVYTLQYSLQQSFDKRVATCAYIDGALTKVDKAVMHSNCKLLNADGASMHRWISAMLTMLELGDVFTLMHTYACTADHFQVYCTVYTCANMLSLNSSIVLSSCKREFSSNQLAVRKDSKPQLFM